MIINPRYTLRSAALVFGLAFAMPALSMTVASIPVAQSLVSTQKQFRINPELGRAWVEVSMSFTDNDVSESYRYNVPGLRYDTSLKQVIFEQAGKSITCATISPAGFGPFKRERVTPTGACQLGYTKVQKAVDTGFEIKPVHYVEVRMTPRFG